MGAAEVEAFLTHLAVERSVAASTQNQALAALLFLYREVLSLDMPWLDKFTPAKHSTRVPVVLTKAEAFLLHSERARDLSKRKMKGVGVGQNRTHASKRSN